MKKIVCLLLASSVMGFAQDAKAKIVPKAQAEILKVMYEEYQAAKLVFEAYREAVLKLNSPDKDGEFTSDFQVIVQKEKASTLFCNSLTGCTTAVVGNK